MEWGLPVLTLPDVLGVQQFVVQSQILDPTEMEDDGDNQVVSAETHVAPQQGQWLNPNGQKLNYDGWLKYGVDSQVIKEGALWSFDTEPPSTSWANHQSAVKYSEKLSVEIDRLEAAGLIEFAPAGHNVATFISNVNPFGAMATGDPSNPKVRMVVDPTITSVNSHMLPLPLSLPSAQAALHMTKETSVLGKRDLKSGFHHVVLQESASEVHGLRASWHPWEIWKVDSVAVWGSPISCDIL